MSNRRRVQLFIRLLVLVGARPSFTGLAANTSASVCHDCAGFAPYEIFYEKPIDGGKMHKDDEQAR
jgi:hypothetical protein